MCVVLCKNFETIDSFGFTVESNPNITNFERALFCPPKAKLRNPSKSIHVSSKR